MFATQLKILRKSRGVSQRELAEKLNLSQQTIGKWETGAATPNPETINRICDIFSVTSDSLLGRECENGPEAMSKNLKFALFGTTEVDDELLDDVKRLAILQKRLREEKQQESERK